MTAHRCPPQHRLTAAGCSVMLAALSAAPERADRYLPDFSESPAEGAVKVALAMAGVNTCARCLLYVMTGVVGMMAEQLYSADAVQYETAVDFAETAAEHFLDQAAAE